MNKIVLILNLLLTISILILIVLLIRKPQKEKFTIESTLMNEKCMTPYLKQMNDEIVSNHTKAVEISNRKIIDGNTATPESLSNYNISYKNYTDKFYPKFKELKDCSSYCLQGNISTGECICPTSNPIPLQIEGKIYCVKDNTDSSGNFFYTDLNSQNLMPEQPKELTETRGINSTILSWTEPNSLFPIKGYKIFSDGVEIGNVKDKTFTISNISTDKIYNFSVSAGSEVGYGIKATLQSLPKLTTPSSVFNLSSVIVGNLSVKVSWFEPDSNIGLNITGYKILRNEVEIFPDIINNSFTDASGLNIATTYTYSVSPYNSIGYGAPVMTSIKPATVPSAPTLVSAVAGLNTITLNWSSNSNGGSPITRWLLYRDDGSVIKTKTIIQSTTLITSTVLKVGSTSSDFDNISNTTVYDFSLRAQNLIGISQESNKIRAKSYISTTSKPNGIITYTGRASTSIPYPVFNISLNLGSYEGALPRYYSLRSSSNTLTPNPLLVNIVFPLGSTKDLVIKNNDVVMTNFSTVTSLLNTGVSCGTYYPGGFAIAIDTKYITT
jgi:hypothetical protein